MDLGTILSGVSAEESKEKAAFIPAGQYNVVLEKITERKNETGWKGLSFQLRVFGNRFNNYCLFDLVTIAHATSKEAIDIGLQRLKKITDLTGESDTAKMLGKKFHVNVGVVDDKYKIKNGEAGAQMNTIWGYGEMIAMDNTPAPLKNAPSFNSDEIPF